MLKERVNQHINLAKQTADQAIADASANPPVMPDKMDALYDFFLAKFNTSKDLIYETWLEVLRGGKVANELGELTDLYDALDALSKLKSLELDMNTKEIARQEAWEKYSIHTNDVSTDSEHERPLRGSTLRRSI